MSVGDALATIAQGRRSAALLGACRLQWAGVELMGEEAILESFRTAPLDLADATLVETPVGAALVGADAALVADLYDGRVGRLWRVGAGEPPAAEPSIAVAADPDLRQERGGVYARAEDHPTLAPAAFAALVAAGHELVDGDNEAQHRARAFLLRGVGDADAAAGLFVVQRLTGGVVRQAGVDHAVVLAGPAGTGIVRDRLPAREWTPRL